MMGETGVSYYTKAKLDKPIYFPEDQVCCWYCLMFNKHTEECRITNNTTFKPKQNIGLDCPLKIIGGDKSNE